MFRIYRGLLEVHPSYGIPDFGRFVARAAAVNVSGRRARQNLPLTGRSRDPRVSQTGSPTDGLRISVKKVVKVRREAVGHTVPE
jgi:hypothetical protein